MPPAQNSVAWRDALGERSTNGQGGRDTKTLLIATALIAGIGIVAAQDQVPGNKSEAAAPAPPAQQNAPPDKITPGPLNSPMPCLRTPRRKPMRPH